MLCTIPDYYKEFSCIAADCEDTCCAGWQIVIDEKSKRRYAKAATGLNNIEKNLARELRRCVNWREGVFRQDTEKRCAFLNQDNLCRLYQMAGPDSLCRTCKMYPRHIEEFEGVREITLSLSCPEAARIILGKKNPVHFLSYEKPGEEDYGDFDLFFYSQLVDARNWLYVLMDADKLLYGGLASVYEDSVKSDAEQKGNAIQKGNIAQKGGEEQSEEDIDQLRYFVNLQEFELWKQEHMPDWDIMLEQMLVYFVFTYFCGAVYDGRIQAKMQVCVYSVYIIEEILRARWLENEKTLSMEEVVELTYRYSREVEHSDQNPERLEHFMEKNPWIRVKK